jgi:hypothetical protein
LPLFSNMHLHDSASTMATESSSPTTTTTTMSHKRPLDQASSATATSGRPVKAIHPSFPSPDFLVRMRSYKMPASMKLPYDPQSPMGDPSSQYLESFLASRRANLFKLRQQFAADLALTQPKNVDFAPVMSDASLNTEPPSLRDEAQEPLPKRRRFQRRNSKTPAMLLNSLSDILGKYDDDDDDNCETEPCSKPPKLDSSSSNSDPNTIRDQVLGGSLKIAEELVRQLQLRKHRNEQAGSAKSRPFSLY